MWVGSTESRYAEVSRRAMLKGLGVAAAAGALAGCSNKDDQVFVSSPTDSSIDPATSTPPAPEALGTSGAAPVPAAATGAPLAATARLTVEFTFATTGEGGRGPARNPYIAVWVENAGEELVHTLAIWHMQQNERWLHELKRWYTVSGGFEVNTGPTRVPGSYTVEWDGTGRAGRVTSGGYFICIEAAREHGPYELIREPIELGASPMRKTLAPSNELTAAAVSYTV